MLREGGRQGPHGTEDITESPSFSLSEAEEDPIDPEEFRPRFRPVPPPLKRIGRVRLKQRLLRKQGLAVVDVSSLDWNEVHNVDDAAGLLRKLIQPHMRT